jgi:hypothetical protein
MAFAGSYETEELLEKLDVIIIGASSKILAVPCLHAALVRLESSMSFET